VEWSHHELPEYWMSSKKSIDKTNTIIEDPEINIVWLYTLNRSIVLIVQNFKFRSRNNIW
jgi:hypothetical protein